MAKKIQMYKVFDETLEELVGVESTIQFYYRDAEKQEMPLVDELDYEYKTLLSDDEDSWDFVERGFGIRGQVLINQPSSLFTELVSGDAELGIALQWISKQSLQRKVIPLETITQAMSEGLTIPVDYYFNSNQLFGEVNVTFILYLKKASQKPQFGEAVLTGTILGELAEWQVILDGSGSTFPIVIINEADKPLWYVDFNYSEPLLEPFDKEYIAIYLNEAHPAFPSIHKPKNKLDQALYIEFLAGALQLIIQDLMQCSDWADIQEGRNCEEGSIGQVMYYLKKTLEWDLDRPEKLAISLRKDLAARVKVGEL